MSDNRWYPPDKEGIPQREASPRRYISRTYRGFYNGSKAQRYLYEIGLISDKEASSPVPSMTFDIS